MGAKIAVIQKFYDYKVRAIENLCNEILFKVGKGDTFEVDFQSVAGELFDKHIIHAMKQADKDSFLPQNVPYRMIKDGYRNPEDGILLTFSRIDKG